MRSTRSLAVLALVAAMGSPSAALAGSRDQLFVGLTGGITVVEGRARFTGGLDTAYGFAWGETAIVPTAAGFARLRIHNAGVEGTLGGRGGMAYVHTEHSEYEMPPFRYYPLASGDGELGLTLRSRGGLGIAGGLSAGSMLFGASGGTVLDLAGKEAGDLVATRVDGVFRLPLLSTGIAIPGRPLRDAADQVVRAPVFRSGEAAAADRWVDEGRDEFAAIAAFGRLARELAALGAPPALITRALAAAADEIVHARLCFGMAEVHDGGPLLTAPLSAPIRRFGSRTEALVRLALESLHDGALNEGAAGERAQAESEATADADEAEVKALIADDERGHATLGRDIVAWCAREGGATVRSAVAEAERAIA